MNKFEVVIDIIFIPDHCFKKIENPGKKPFNFPSSAIAPEYSAILCYFFLLLVRCGAISSIFFLLNRSSKESLSYALSPIIHLGFSLMYLALIVSSTSFISWVFAPEVRMAIGRSEAYAIAMILVLLPFLVFPKPSSLFWHLRKYHLKILKSAIIT